MTSKHLTLSFSPDDFSWLISKAESLGKFPDEYIEDLIDQARTRDLMGGKVVHHLDGDPRNLELSNVGLRDAPSDDMPPCPHESSIYPPLPDDWRETTKTTGETR